MGLTTTGKATPATLKGRARQKAIAKQAAAPDHARAWELHVKHGWSFRRIGAELGVNAKTAWSWCDAIREELHVDLSKRAHAARDAAVERLSEAAAHAAVLYMQTDDPKHLTASVAAEGRIAALLGSDAPKQVEVKAEVESRVMLIPATMTRSQWEAEHGDAIEAD